MIRKILYTLCLAGVMLSSVFTLRANDDETFKKSFKSFVTQEKSVFAPGEEVFFDVKTVYPADYKPLYYRIYVNGKDLPGDFAAKTNSDVNKYNVVYIKKGKLAHPNGKGYFVCPRGKNSGDIAQYSFSTANWPAGSYTVTLQITHVHKDAKSVPANRRYPYSYSQVSFTLEKPAAAVAAPADVLDSLPWQEGLTELATGKKPAEKTRFKYFVRNSVIYMRIEAFERNMDKLLLDKMPADAGDIWRNDSVELVIATAGNEFTFYKFLIDAAGQFCDMLLTDDNTNRRIYNAFPEWKSFAEYKVVRLKNSYIVDFAIPLANMVDGKSASKNFRFNIVRHRRAGEKLVSTTLARLPDKKLNRPECFVKLEVNDFQAARYNVRLENITPGYRRSGELDIEALLKSDSALDPMVRIVYNLTDGKKNYTFSSVEPLTGKTHRKAFAALRGMTDGEYHLEYQIFSNTALPILLSGGSSKLELVYNPLKLAIRNPAYRNAIFATMPDKTLRFTIDNEFDTALLLSCTLTGKSVAQSKNITAKPGLTEVSFDMASLPDGTYTLSVTDNKKLTRSEVIRKLPYCKGEVWLDDQGITYVDGVKTMPFGWFGNQPYEPDKSLNLLVLHTPFASVEHAKQVIADNLKTGQRTAIYFTQEITGKAWDKAKLFAENNRKGGLSKAQEAQIRKFVAEISHTDGLFAYYMADEPEGHNHSPLFYEQALKILQEVDPYHPGFMLNYGLEGIKRFYKGGDILMPDCYPQYFEDGSTSKLRTSASSWIKTASALRPAWLCTQMTMWPYRSSDGRLRGIAPDYRDQQMQFFQALIHNAKGFGMYTYYRGQIFSDMIIGHVEIGQTLQMLKDYLLENTIVDGVKNSVDDPALQLGIKKFNGKYCLIAVNTSLQKQKIDLRFSCFKDHTFYEAGSGKVFTVKNHRMIDTLEPKETVIYLSDKLLAEKIPSTADVERRVAELKRLRKKPGNLVGTGELYEADYRDMFNGKYPENITRVTVSSEKPNYTTKGMDTRYFLLDGLTEPTWADFMWTPQTSDKAPWLELLMPQAKRISRIKLYSPGCTMGKGKVVVENQSFAFDATGKNSIEINITPTVSSKVRIEFTRSAVKPLPGPFANRFLSEVEVY